MHISISPGSGCPPEVLPRRPEPRQAAQRRETKALVRSASPFLVAFFPSPEQYFKGRRVIVVLQDFGLLSLRR